MDERIALVRPPSSRMADGIVTYVDRIPADAALAARQHERYVAALADSDWGIREVAPADDLPDSAFVEDTVVVLGDLAVLHLKSAVTALPDGRIVGSDPSLVDDASLPALQQMPEEGGSHVVPLGGRGVLMAESAPRSAELLDGWGFDVVTVDISEFEKLEGCVTCLSVLVDLVT